MYEEPNPDFCERMPNDFYEKLADEMPDSDDLDDRFNMVQPPPALSRHHALTPLRAEAVGSG